MNPYIPNSVHNSTVQLTTIVQAVVYCLANMTIQLNNVSAILIWNAFHMAQIYKDVLRTLPLMSLHMTFNAHIIKLTLDQCRMHFSEMKGSIWNLTKFFKLSPAMSAVTFSL